MSDNPIGTLQYLKEGQLIFQSLPNHGDASLVQLIEDATNSDLTHVGIITHGNGGWMVIEAIGQKVIKTPLDLFIGRNPGKFWLKNIEGLTGTTMAKRFVEAASSYLGMAYDFDFKPDNGKLYCSELVFIAAKKAGFTIRGAQIPAGWLDCSKKSVLYYLSNAHGKSSCEEVDWTIIPPNTLFYSNDLKTPKDFTRAHVAAIPNNALYDTLPGVTVAEKFAYLQKAWGDRTKIAHYEKKDIDGQTIHRFYLKLDGRQYSLILFNEFTEERELAGKVLKLLQPTAEL